MNWKSSKTVFWSAFIATLAVHGLLYVATPSTAHADSPANAQPIADRCYGKACRVASVIATPANGQVGAANGNFGTVDAGFVITSLLDAGNSYVAGTEQVGTEIAGVYKFPVQVSDVVDFTSASTNGSLKVGNNQSTALAVSNNGADILQSWSTLAGNEQINICPAGPTTDCAFVDVPTTGVTAHAGGGQALATAAKTDYAVANTVATTNDSVLLPPCRVGRVAIWVNNAKNSNTLAVFPPGSGTIDAFAASTAYQLAGATTATARRFLCVDGTAWVSW